MPLYNKLPESLKEVDVIIAGGGTAACIVAGRLAAAQPSLEILVVEYGKDNYDVPTVVYPALFSLNLVPGNQTAIFYDCDGGPSLNGRKHIIPTGGVLGGGSSINFLMYTRAQRADFDSWKTEGWGADEMIPYLQKLETYHGVGDKKVHGYDGPIHVSDGGFSCESTRDDFLAAAGKIGYPTIKDLQDLDSNNAFSPWQRTISPEGKRQDTAHAYLHPLLRDGNHPNLHVLTETKVSRVLFDSDGTASGIEFLTIPMENRSLNEHGQSQTIRARKMVVVSCGAVATPMVLERSGLGNPQIIEDMVEKVVADLPGVGANYQDHHLIFYPYKVKLGENSTLGILKSEGGFEKAVADKSPLLGWNTVDVCSKIRPTEVDIDKLGPDFRQAWDRDYKDHPNRPLMLSGFVSAYLGDTQGLDEGDVVSCANYSAYPYSRGTVHIQKDIEGVPSAPHFVPGFFTDKGDLDVKMHIWAYKMQREIIRRTKMYRGELAIGHPKFPEGSNATCKMLPLNDEYDPDSVKGDIEYTKEDDKAIENWLRDNIETTWHSLGTAKMAPREDGGVVDKNLSVYGVKGLKVVDLSIVPENVAANTCNTAMVIGEKGADIIAKELGFSLNEQKQSSNCMIL